MIRDRDAKFTAASGVVVLHLTGAKRCAILQTMLGKPPRDRLAERRSSARAEIIEAAWEIARAQGLAGFTLRDVATRVGMRAPSLYSYFDSKNAIYDAMFARGCREYRDGEQAVAVTGDALTDLKRGMRFFFDFCVADPVRYQLLFQRTIPGFEPTEESYAVAVAGLDVLRSRLAKHGITDARAFDLLTAIGTGLTSQQISNEPGGDRWGRLVDAAMEMFFAYVSERNFNE
jgi:AcrR family transcriptional regulator